MSYFLATQFCKCWQAKTSADKVRQNDEWKMSKNKKQSYNILTRKAKWEICFYDDLTGQNTILAVFPYKSNTRLNDVLLTVQWLAELTTFKLSCVNYIYGRPTASIERSQNWTTGLHPGWCFLRTRRSPRVFSRGLWWLLPVVCSWILVCDIIRPELYYLCLSFSFLFFWYEGGCQKTKHNSIRTFHTSFNPLYASINWVCNYPPREGLAEYSSLVVSFNDKQDSNW